MIDSVLNCLDILALKNLKGFGNKTILKIINKYGKGYQDYSNLCSIIQDLSSPKKQLTQAAIDTAYQQAEQSLEQHHQHEITIISYVDKQFPQQLREINSPPLILYLKGDLSILDPDNSVAVIGTRNPTPYGEDSGFKIGKRLAESGLIVVSGLATGCDTAGHQGCLAAGGKTVAVLAHGLHTIYPPCNQQLAAKIVENGGCLLSEYPYGYNYYPNTFIQRDRLQSGLSTAVIVIETDLTGGTMHTVRFSLQQKRILACLAYPPDKQQFLPKGNQQLLTSGKAIPISNKEDLLSLIATVKQ